MEEHDAYWCPASSDVNEAMHSMLCVVFKGTDQVQTSIQPATFMWLGRAGSLLYKMLLVEHDLILISGQYGAYVHS